MAILGIDLGTTHSLVGIIEKGRPRLFQGPDGKNLIPSVVYFNDNGKTIVGAEAKRKKAQPSRTLYSAKRFLGRGLSDVKHLQSILPFDFSQSTDAMVRFTVTPPSGAKSVTPIEISQIILKELKDIAEKELKEPVKKAVITVPAYFNDAQRSATKFAGELAGLEVVRILNEPTAACMAYGINKKAKGTVVVFDLGGGTFDISILRITDGVFEVLATNGDTALGGDDFDHQIAFYLRNEMLTKVGEDAFDTAENRSLLIQASEQLKIALSENMSFTFSFRINGRAFQRVVTREEVEGWIRPVLERAKTPSELCLKDAGLAVSEISDVILVGGSTRMPLVRELVQQLFSREPICTLNPDEVVAMGAAVQANIIAGQSGEILLLDVLPLSLGIETMGGVVSKIIHRNSTIPISASQTFTTYVDGQVRVGIHVLQGEREFTKDNRSLARFELKDLPPLPAGIPKIEVEFTVDANGLLSVRAQELRTGKSASVVVNPSFGLSDTEVETMLLASFDNAEKDFENRFLTESRVEAESMIRSTRKAIERGKSLFINGEQAKVNVALQNLELSLTETDYRKIRKLMDELNESTRGFAERLMNQAVSDALKEKEIP